MNYWMILLRVPQSYCIVFLFPAALLCGCSRGSSTESLEHFRASVVYIQKSFELEPRVNGVGTISQEKMAAIADLRKLALKEAEAVDVSSLSQLHPDMRKHFENEYLRGLRQWVEGYEKDDVALLNRGTLLINDWGSWYKTAVLKR